MPPIQAPRLSFFLAPNQVRGTGLDLSVMFDSTNNALRVNLVAGGAGDGKILDGTAAGQADVIASAPVGTEQGLVTRNIPSGTQTVSGTITANAGTGTFNFNLTQVGGTALSGAGVADAANNAFRVNCVIGCGSSSFADNSAFTFGTTAVSNAGAVVDDTATNAVTENNAGAPRMSGSRVLYSNLRDASGNEVATATAQPAGTERGLIVREAQKGQATMANSAPVAIASDQSAIPVTDNAGSLTVDGTVTANAGTGVFDVTPASPVATDYLPARITDGTNFLGASANPVRVDPTGTTTQPVSGTVTANAGTGTFNTQDSANGATGSAVPARAMFLGYRNDAGNLTGVIRCDLKAPFSLTALNGSSQIIALVASQKIYICHASFAVSAAVKVKLIEGTGTNCATGPSDVTGQYPLAANGGAVLPFDMNPLETGTAGDALCINTSAAADVGGVIQYAQF